METITNIGNKKYRIDLANKRIDFLDTRFYTTADGGWVPSVTTILDCYPKGAGYYEWLKRVGEDADEIRDEAGDRGSVVHGLTELYDRGDEVKLIDENGRITVKMFEWAMFERYIDFRTRFPHEISLIEQNIVSAKLGYAGTLDRKIKFLSNGKKYLVDIKSGGGVWPSFWLQLAAYKNLYYHEIFEPAKGLNIAGIDDIDGVGILWLNAKTKTDGKKDSIQGKGWQLLLKEDTSKDLELFEATRQLWIAENGSLTPKQLSYKISHKLAESEPDPEARELLSQTTPIL